VATFLLCVQVDFDAAGRQLVVFGKGHRTNSGIMARLTAFTVNS